MFDEVHATLMELRIHFLQKSNYQAHDDITEYSFKYLFVFYNYQLRV